MQSPAQFGANFVEAQAKQVPEQLDERQRRALAFLDNSSDSEEQNRGDGTAAGSRVSRVTSQLTEMTDALEDALEQTESFADEDFWKDQASLLTKIVQMVEQNQESITNVRDKEFLTDIDTTFELLDAAIQKGEMEEAASAAKESRREFRRFRALVTENLPSLREMFQSIIAMSNLEPESEDEDEQQISISDSELSDIDLDELEDLFRIDLRRNTQDEAAALLMTVYSPAETEIMTAQISETRRTMKPTDITSYKQLQDKTTQLSLHSPSLETQLRIFIERLAAVSRLTVDALIIDVPVLRSWIGDILVLLRLLHKATPELVEQVNGQAQVSVVHVISSAVTGAVNALQKLAVLEDVTEEDSLSLLRFEGVLYAIAALIPVALRPFQGTSAVADVQFDEIRLRLLHWKRQTQRAGEAVAAIATSFECEPPTPSLATSVVSLNGHEYTVVTDPQPPTVAVWALYGLPENVDGDKTVVGVIDTLAARVYEGYRIAGHDESTVLYSLLLHVFCLANNGEYERARDLLLSSRAQEKLTDAQPATVIALNRAVIALGLSAFICGRFADASSHLSELCFNSRSRELLGQLFAIRARDNDDDDSTVGAMEQGLVPSYRHIPLEQADVAFFVSVAIVDLPHVAQLTALTPERDPVALQISRGARRLLQHAARISVHGCSELPRDHAALAAQACLDGNWNEAKLHVESLRGACAQLALTQADGEALFQQVYDQFQSLALRCFLITRSWTFENMPLDFLVVCFGLKDERQAQRIVLSALLRHDLPARYCTKTKSIEFIHNATQAPLSAILSQMKLQIERS